MNSQIAFTGLPTPVDNCHVLRISALTRCNRHGKMCAHLNVAPTSAVAQAFKPHHLVAPLLHLRCLPSPPFEPAKTCVCCSGPTFFREVRGRQAGGSSQSAVASRRGRGRTLRGHLRWRGPQVSLSHASGAPSLRSCAPYCPSKLSCLVSELWDNINISDTEICRPASLVARLSAPVSVSKPKCRTEKKVVVNLTHFLRSYCVGVESIRKRYIWCGTAYLL